MTVMANNAVFVRLWYKQSIEQDPHKQPVLRTWYITNWIPTYQNVLYSGPERPMEGYTTRFIGIEWFTTIQ